MRGFPDWPVSLDETLWSGSYPAVLDRGIPPADWYASYVSTYVERKLGLGTPAHEDEPTSLVCVRGALPSSDPDTDCGPPPAVSNPPHDHRRSLK